MLKRQCSLGQQKERKRFPVKAAHWAIKTANSKVVEADRSLHRMVSLKWDVTGKTWIQVLKHRGHGHRRVNLAITC